MTSYVKSTNFASKDSLATGNPLKIVKGTEIDTEFNNIATAVATKADIVSPTFTGTPAAPTATAGTNTTQIATTAFVQQELTAHTVSTDQIENDAVTSDKIANSAVGTTEIANDAVTAAKIAASAVGTSELSDSAVTTVKIADNNVTTNKVANAAITAAKLSGAQTGNAPIYGCRAWVNFDGTKDTSGTVSTDNTNRLIRASGNVTSVVRNGVGDYTINFTTALPDAYYCVIGTSSASSTANTRIIGIPEATAPTDSALRILTQADSGAVQEATYNNIAIFR